MRGFVIMCCDVFNVWPKTTLLHPVWPRDTKRLDAPGRYIGYVLRATPHPNI